MASNGVLKRSEGADFFSAKVFSEAWKACSAAYNNGFVKKEIGNNITCIAFCGSQLDGSALSQTANKFGVCEINCNNDYFGSMIDGSARKQPPQQALVHQGALQQFLDVWNNSSLQQQVTEALAGGKTILFTGHFIGGAIATLAALANLEKWHKGTSVFCVTFGFPLIGDEVLARAVRRKGWANRFCHVVLRGDIFSRILFAPCISVSGPLEAMLPYWRRSMQQRDHDDTLHSSTDITMQETLPENLDISKFFSTVLQHASSVVNYTLAANMAPTNKLIESLLPAVKLSPYRPFGYYVFCSGSGAVWVGNYEAVLPILYYTLAASAKDQALDASLLEHIGYGRAFPNVIKNMVKLDRLSNLALSQAAVSSSQERAIATQLDALGLGIQNVQARLALRAAGELEKHLIQNTNKLEEELYKLENTGGPMAELKLYHNVCMNKGLAYYDCFKKQETDEDFQANINRLKLSGFWDKVVEMVEKHQLPDDFQCREEWIKAGTDYRCLVEPLDICNYYRLGKHEDSGHYLTSGRPFRYKALQKWLGDRERNVGNGSCFWAYVEEITWCMNNNDGDVEAECEEFQRHVKAMLDSNEVRVEEIVMEESTFMKWWNKLSPQDREASPLSFIFVGTT